jgi:acetyl esterase/lipase
VIPRPLNVIIIMNSKLIVANIVSLCMAISFASFALRQNASGQDASSGQTNPEVHRLWSAEAPFAGGSEAIDMPTLRLYRAESKEQTACVVVLPGGGYGNLAMDHEGTQIAAWLNEMGVTAAICVYRHRGGGGNGGKGYGDPVPMLDAQRAIRMVRAMANEWNIDPVRVGVIGFSAGGHLASTVSTHHDPGKPNDDDAIERVSSRPDFSILAYPVIAFDKSFTHRGSQKNLLGENADPELIASLSNELMVTAETPPTFLFHTAEDKAVPPENSVVYFSSLLAAGVPAEMHVFEKGKHGVGLAKGISGTNAWPELCKAWLRSRAIVK